MLNKTCDWHKKAARVIGRQIIIVKAGAVSEFDSAFATIVQQRVGALVIAGDPFFNSRRTNGSSLGARDLPAARICSGWRPAELRYQPSRRLSSGGYLCGSNS